ncbi:TPA: hypothetical protein I7791_22730 [Vibrio vulnificus]|nr:hypothetical protein CRN47_20310 [Vibrio vulnificus]POB22062.1 hypothetical protein CRN22_18585 [Vibrio vulnificus]HAS8133677.1 hypothetical protein [Vibrio vulnificus]HAS8561236.1 hypothetical protein [Vibrio vulnificus]
MSLITYTYYGIATQTATCRSTTKHNKAFKSDSQRLAFFIPSLVLCLRWYGLGLVVALLTP